MTGKRDSDFLRYAKELLKEVDEHVPLPADIIELVYAIQSAPADDVISFFKTYGINITMDRADRPTYILHPGIVRSVNDGDIHFISASRLAVLYGLHNGQWISADSEQAKHGFSGDGRMVHLWPKSNGIYELP